MTIDKADSCQKCGKEGGRAVSFEYSGMTMTIDQLIERLIERNHGPDVVDAIGAIERLRAENERLRKDAELLNWVESHPEPAMRQLSSRWSACGRGFREEYFNFRGSIVAAMEGK